jgi:hypothetical protein
VNVADFVAVVDLVDLDLEALPLRPSHVHPKQHVGPIHRLRATGPCLHRPDRVVAVVRAGQERRELDLLQVALQNHDGAVELLGEIGVVRVGQELVDRDRIAELAVQIVEAVEHRLQARERRSDPLTLGRVVPQGRIRGLPFQLGGLHALAVDVKGTPWRRRRARRGPGVARYGRSSNRECIGTAILRR